jgi:hypothetical protein
LRAWEAGCAQISMNKVLSDPAWQNADCHNRPTLAKYAEELLVTIQDTV